MKVIWIIDNKFRELYGLYDLKKKLLDHKIYLYFFHIPIWKTAIDLVNPNIIIVPNLAKRSCEPIVRYASKKKINVIMHSSEGMFYTDEVQKEKYPIHLIKKINKVLAWSKLDAKFLINKGFKKKVLISGCLKFDKKNYLNINQNKKKIKVIGIPTHSRVISGYGISKNNIPYHMRHLIENHEKARIGYLKFELEYIQCLVNILKEIGKSFKIVLKISPFEDPEIYKKTFPEFEIYEGRDIRDFLRNVDVILNVYSSAGVDALKFNVPVISLSKFINWDKTVLNDKNRGPMVKNNASNLALQPKNIFELKKLLGKNKKNLIDMCVKRNFVKRANELALTCESLKIFTKFFIEYKKKISFRYPNYFMLFKYFAVELRQIIFRRKRSKTLFKLWSPKDRKLLKLLRL